MSSSERVFTAEQLRRLLPVTKLSDLGLPEQGENPQHPDMVEDPSGISVLNLYQPDSPDGTGIGPVLERKWASAPPPSLSPGMARLYDNDIFKQTGKLQQTPKIPKGLFQPPVWQGNNANTELLFWQAPSPVQLGHAARGFLEKAEWPKAFEKLPAVGTAAGAGLGLGAGALLAGANNLTNPANPLPVTPVALLLGLLGSGLGLNRSLKGSPGTWTSF